MAPPQPVDFNARSHGTASRSIPHSAFNRRKLPLTDVEAEAACTAEASLETTMPSIANGDSRARRIKALAVQAQEKAKTSTAEAERLLREAQDLVDACMSRTSAAELQKIDLESKQAAAHRARSDAREAKAMLDEVTVSADDANKNKFGLILRPWAWVTQANTSAHAIAEATEKFNKAVDAATSAEEDVRVSQRCLDVLVTIQQQLWDDAVERASSCHTLRARAMAARVKDEEAAAAAARAKEKEAAKIAQQVAEAAAQALHEAVTISQQKRPAERAANTKSSRRQGGVMVGKTDCIKASKLNTLWAVCDAFDECTAPPRKAQVTCFCF